MKYSILLAILCLAIAATVLAENHEFHAREKRYAPDLPGGLKVRGWSEEGGWIVEDFRGRRQSQPNRYNRPQLRSLDNYSQYPPSENSEWIISHRSANEITYRRRVPYQSQSRPRSRPELRSGNVRVHMDGFNERSYHPGKRINYVDQNAQEFHSYRY